MGLFSRNKEAVTNPAEEQKKGKETILNDAKFMASLDAHPNVDADSDFETLKKAHESFQAKETTSKELQVLFKKEIRRDLGINFDAAEQKEIAAEIDKFLESELIDNPERIIELKAQISQFNEFQKQIEDQKQILEKLGVSVDSLLDKRVAIDQVQATKKWFQKIRSKSTDHENARVSAEKDYGVNLKDLKAEQARVTELFKNGLSAESEIKTLQENFKELRSKILQELAPMAAMQELAQNKVKEKLESLMDPSKAANKTVKGVEAARKLLEKIIGDEFHVETGIDYKSADIDADAFFSELNENLDNAFKEDVEKAVGKVAGNSLTLKKMKDGLAPMFEKTELGDKSGSEVREFLLDYLKGELMEKLSKSQQILLTAAIESFA